MWQGPVDAPVSVVFSTGDEGQIHDVLPATLASGWTAAGFRVLCIGCVGGPLASRDRRLRDQIRAHHPGGRLVLAGHSRGARVSATLVEDLGAIGLIACSFPFHAKTDPRTHGREKRLYQDVPVLLVQGTRDSLGNQQQVRGYGLSSSVEVHWMQDANHALCPRVKSGTTQEALLAGAVLRTTAFLQLLSSGQGPASS